MAASVETGWLPRHRVQVRRPIHLRSHNDKDFAGRCPAVVKALARLPDETVIDGQVVALDEQAVRPSADSRTTGRQPAR